MNIKIYSQIEPTDSIEVKEITSEDAFSIDIDIDTSECKSIIEFSISRDDVMELIAYLKKQFQL